MKKKTKKVIKKTKIVKKKIDPIKLWVKELRSNRYKQDTNALRTENGYCCLGVACDLYRKVKKDGTNWESNDNGFSFLGCYGELPTKVMDWLGLDSDTGYFNNEDYSSLAELNDNGATFKEIADIIEQNLDSLKAL